MQQEDKPQGVSPFETTVYVSFVNVTLAKANHTQPRFKEKGNRPHLLMEGAAVSSCQGTGARRESVASVPVYHAGFGIWGSACLDSAHSLYTGTSREMSQILLKM